MASQIDIWNNALSEIASERISSVDEASLQAAECNRIWPGLIDEYLTWVDWEEQHVRVVLAAKSNDRASEWLYRYAKPADLAEVMAVIPDYAYSLDYAPFAGPFTTPPIAALGNIPYALSGDDLYCNLENASLQYVSTALQVGRIRPLARRALELELAARLAMPIKKSRELKGDLIKSAEVARSRAVAEQENRSKAYGPNYTSAAEFARAGFEDGGGYC